MKIKSLEIIDDEKLGNLKLDFTKNGVAQDTIILAGNNGCGKTTILEEIMLLSESGIASHLDREKGKIKAVIDLSNQEIEEIKSNIHRNSNSIEGNKLTNEIELEIDFSEQKGTYGRFKIYAFKNQGKQEIKSYDILYHGKLEEKISSFYSAANIDYTLKNITNITTIDLDDSNMNAIKMSNDAGTEIKQTFIDIYNLDAQDFQEWASKNIGQKIDKDKMFIRLNRFKKAFKYMMDDLEFDKIANIKGKKEVLFKRNGKKIRIDDLSTGEKQIVIRGGYLLRYLNNIQGSIILMDEPELSLHPDWQKKIIQFYKKLFIDTQGKQTSQIFIATHSPFIINNSSRYNDKVIVLCRNKDNGNIEVLDKPKYYDCNNSVYIKEAFDINNFDTENNILFTEGETDKKYFLKAIELFFNNNVNFKVDWIGSYNSNGNIVNTGCTGLNNLLKVLEANNELFSKKIGLLYDCDTKKEKEKNDKYFVYTLKKQENQKYKIGVENLLSLPVDFDYDMYLKKIQKTDEYGAISEISELDKVKLCDYICASENAEDYLVKFKNVIEEIEKLMNN